MPRLKKSNRADGRYEIKRTVGQTADHKPVRISFYGKNRDDAIRQYQEYLEMQEKRSREKKNMLFESWVEKWLEVYKYHDVKASTYLTTYERPCKNYIVPYFQGRFIQDITQLHVKGFLNSISHLSQSLLDKIVICLRGIFESAIDNEIVQKNPCRNISIKSTAKKAKKRTYDQESVDALCAVDHKYGIYVHILLKMGLRCSELCGLRWKDIDLNNATMTIEQALTSEGSRIFIDEPKTANSKRRLPIPPDLVERLRTIKDGRDLDMSRRKPETISKAEKEGYIAVLNGRHITPNHFGDRQMEAFYNFAGVPSDKRLSPHELRHTCGTLLYKNVKDIYHVSRFLGHSDIGITTKTYVHSEMQEEYIHIDI